MKETVVEVKDVSIKFNMSSEKYDILQCPEGMISNLLLYHLYNIFFETVIFFG